jgi:HEAT repeat protein
VTSILFASVLALSAPPTEAPQPWLFKLSDGYAQARHRGQPVFVRFGAASCPWCRKLEAELRDPALAKELERWTLVSLDVVDADRDARAMAVGPVPALRILTANGRVVASREGFAPANELAEWLKKHHDAAAAVPAEELTATAPPDAAAVGKLVAELNQRDPALREAAVRRLLPHPKLTAKPVAAAFGKGSLQTRLSALELLKEWNAPVADLDPWRPESLAAAKLDALYKWAESPPEAGAAPATRDLTAVERKDVRAELARMLTVPDTEAAAIRERLARFGPALLGEVYNAAKDAATDTARERLTALRYRLVAGDTLALRWPGGLDRLASTRAPVRHDAVLELARRATAADEPLLLELFGSPDPFVRELSLRILHTVAGKSATGSLAKLLKDPDPNVRAAVLKQLSETPAPKTVPQIAEYVKTETDPDLIGHAVKVFRSAGGAEAVGHLKGLLRHASWRVRAEAVEAAAEIVNNYNSNLPANLKTEVTAAIRGCLADPDGFVVGRAIGALKKGNDAANVEPLVKAAAAHPELTPEVVTALSYGSSIGQAALPHLREYCKHKDPAVRAKAIAAVRETVPNESAPELRAGLGDPVGQVRQAAAAQVYAAMESKRSSQASNAERNSRNNPKADKFDPDKIAADLRGGKDRPEGFADLLPLLVQLAKADDPSERLEAALALVVLDRVKDAVPVLLACASADAHLVGGASRALPWLPWEQRLDVFGKLRTSKTDEDGTESLVRWFSEAIEPRAAGPLWDMAAKDPVSGEVAGQIASAIVKLALGERYGPQAPDRPGKAKKLAEEATVKAKAGAEMQRLVALAVLADTDQAEAGRVAADVFKDDTAPRGLRRDAFQVMLLGRGKEDATAAAVAAMTHPDPAVRRVAAVYLSLGPNNLRQLRERHIYLSMSVEGRMTPGGNTPKDQLIPKAPKGLDKKVLVERLADPDPVTAAASGYLLALFNDPAGLPALVRYWRDAVKDDADWIRLVATAVAGLDDDTKVPLLEEAYRVLAPAGSTERRDDSAIRDLYWTMRHMTGPNARRLRNMIHAEVGTGVLGSPGTDDFAPPRITPPR